MLRGLNSRDRTFIKLTMFSLAAATVVIIVLQYIGYRIQIWEIQQDSNTATLVSLSSEQKTLSQRVALLSLALVSVKSPALKERAEVALEQIVSEMEQNHIRLESGDLGSNVVLPPSEPVKQILHHEPYSLSMKVHEFIQTARAVTNSDANLITADNPQLVQVVNLSSELLSSFTALRDQYKIEGLEGTSRLKFLSAATFWGMVAAAAAMAFGIFLPLVRRLANEFYHRHQHELDLEDQNKELEHFAGVIAHDLKAPLNNIGGFSQFLKTKLSSSSDSEAHHMVQRIEQGAMRMSKMISELFHYVKLSSKERVFKDVDLNRTAQKVLADFETTIQQDKAQVKVQSLPHVWADPVQMEHLLHNLIGNALKYKSNTATPEIQIYAQQSEENFAKLFIDDNGPGLPAGSEEKIFEPFRRLPETSEVEGSGFGLSLCKKIARRHRGSISAENREGAAGARFIVTLPTKPTWAELAK